uniref:HMA domain-containing protein n=2 Tax=Cajanus cajan TaxID=3821 RepID=A0A151U6D8_CAJCA|nr:hypothetical protein KK1_007542 [Cajanus cajan]
MKAVSNISGVESVSMDMKDQELTLTGDMDPVVVVDKLRKLCYTEILSVGPAKEKKPETPELEDQNQYMPGIVMVCEAYHNQMSQPHYYYTSVEENPNPCVIC